ncbi:MAG TPA: class I SAM-dependent methyltransferase [Thermoanaerobaculia bacterium]|nr:class I SAM-dependent methyltransferase [Thermoanaerobaculia bacterium]HUM28517.1 class I SAM-dependent methyltransferase [Thermoanaerobaculia bacterium]HXK66875.1 class I SAM-dependent methyltransferase [Thermoanaerobaculia bacterium]
MVIYDRIAPYYNRVLSRPFFAFLRPAIMSIFETYGIHRRSRILEVACGPGHLCAYLADRAFDITGCDLSIGQRLASSHRQSFPFVVSRMQNLPFRQPFDVILNLYDSLNHLLTLSDLSSTFDETYRLLVPGGWFIFDTNTKLAFKRIWGSRTPFIHEESDFTMVMETRYSSGTRMSEAIVTVRDGEGEIVSTLKERYFTPGEIRNNLKNSGLGLVDKIPWCPSKDAYHGLAVKDIWIARRPDV